MSLKYKLFSIAAVAVSACFCASGQTTATLTLDDCLRIALSENPTVRVADLEVKRLDYSKKEIIGQLLPAIDFGASYNRTLAKQTMYMSMGGGFGGGSGSEEGDAEAPKTSDRPTGIKVGMDNSISVGFQGSMPLISPTLWKSLSISDSQIIRSLETARQSRLQLVNQVKSAYYALLLAEDSKKVIQESYDMAKLTYDTYNARYEIGTASEYDVLRTSVAMKNIEPELAQSDIAIKQARLQLLVLMGLDASFSFRPSDALSNYENTMYEDVIAALDKNYSNNADLRLLDIDADILKKTKTMQKLAFSPTLALTANYNWNSMNNGSPFKNLLWSPYSSVGLSLSIPLFQGGQRVNRIRQTTVQMEELRLQRENLDRSIAMQVDLAIDNIKMNVKQIASCSASVKEADRAYSIMKRSNEIGSASYLDLRDSELALTRSRLTYYQAIYNYLIAGSELELLQGTAPVEKYTTQE